MCVFSHRQGSAAHTAQTPHQGIAAHTAAQTSHQSIAARKATQALHQGHTIKCSQAVRQQLGLCINDDTASSPPTLIVKHSWILQSAQSGLQGGGERTVLPTRLHSQHWWLYSHSGNIASLFTQFRFGPSMARGVAVPPQPHAGSSASINWYPCLTLIRRLLV